MFLDEVTVEFESGKGGDGAATMRREKHVPRGGPNGADGGRGGDIMLIADRHERTLYDLKFKRSFKAQDGKAAQGNKTGRDGESIVIKVPLGTVVHDADLDEPLADLTGHGQEFVPCRGGKGGLGNLHFVNSSRQSPTFAQKGAPSEYMRARLELKLLADVGMVGMPNAGKSTMLSRLSAAKPKIGNYPFTTITPNLGVAKYGTETFVLADLPGLIEGASEGTGLGHQFLRHVERTKVLMHLIDAFPIDDSNPIENYESIKRELKLYSGALAERPTVVALNKIDVAPKEDAEALADLFEEETGLRPHLVSGVSGDGLEALMRDTFALLKKSEEQRDEAVAVIRPDVIKPKEDQEITVSETEEGFEVESPRIRRLVAMTDLENREAVYYLHRKLVRLGVIGKLVDAGAEEGDSVIIGDFEFTYSEVE